MDNKTLKTEADSMIRGAGLPQLLAGYPNWFIGGSYSYDLMCWRDLDVYTLDPEYDLRRCFEVAFQVTQRLKAHKSRFTNNVGGTPSGYYWGIALGNTRQGAWKLDLWFLDQPDYERHAAYSEEMTRKLTPETRATILSIKEAYWQCREFRDTVTSDMIYRAVLEHEVKDVAGFEKLLKEHQ